MEGRIWRYLNDFVIDLGIRVSRSTTSFFQFLLLSVTLAVRVSPPLQVVHVCFITDSINIFFLNFIFPCLEERSGECHN